ncbi:MAG: hypothetical protein K8S97_12890 [Anaerolineae bacterium]|nr:hypothetical protein [Anaerolineae bacterium]
MSDDALHNTPSPLPEDAIPSESGVEWPLTEPPVADDDTQPRPPVAPPQTDTYPTADDQVAALMADPQEWARRPVRPAADQRPPGRPLLMATVMLGAVCMCLMMVNMAGFAGYRDGLATNDAQVTQTLATGIAQQYATGVSDLQAGYAELAAARFAWIVEEIQAPTQYALDSPVQLAVARTIAAYTPTPYPTATMTPTPQPSVTVTPTPEPTQPATATLDPLQDPEYYYQQASTAMRVAHYEDAIEWWDALIALDPTHRPAEVQAGLLDALTILGRMYLAGANEDGTDQLARGIALIRRADEIGPVEPDWLLGEAIFAENFINARNYVNGGYYSAALPVLNDLCNINCTWGYHGVTVQQLQTRAQNGVNGS